MSKPVLAFDLYGTLLSTNSVGKHVKEVFGDKKGESITAAWRRYQLEYTWRYNSMFVQIRLASLTRRCIYYRKSGGRNQGQYIPFSDIVKNTLLHAVAENGLEIAEEDADRMMEAYDSLATFPDVAPALQRLASNPEVECVVFSNGTGAMLSKSVCRSKDLSPYSSCFKDIVTVDDVKRYKPAPETYKYLVRRVGKVGSESTAWLISGNPFDVVGARAIGMQAAWVDRARNGWQDKQGGQPTITVGNLEDLEEAIKPHLR